jgi:hypothetical protein
MAFVAPTVAEFKAQFVRDFPFAAEEGSPAVSTNLAKVTDADITSALLAAGINSNAGLWSTQAEYTYVYNLLAAHYLCVSLLSAAQGIRGAGTWLTQSKTVGDITEAYAIPERIMKSLTLAPLSKTTYGCQFLSLIAPRLVGNVMAIVRNPSAR